MRIAILDLGTNTFHLLIADINNSKATVVFKNTIAVKLGEGGINKKLIANAAFERGMNALKEFHLSIKRFRPDKIKAVATEAMRLASNSDQFIRRVKDETDIEIELISGEKEAEFIYAGVKAAIGRVGKGLIVDIGGGSTELIFFDNEGIQWKKSYPLGAARLMEMLHHSDPISEENISSINLHLDNALPDFLKAFHMYQPETLIGSAGAFETFAELIENSNLPENITAYEFNLSAYFNISNWLVKSEHHQRETNKLIPPVRVDIIVTAAIVTNYIINKTGIKKLKYSSYSLKEGVLYSEIR